MNIYAFIPFIAGVFSLEAGLYILIKAAKNYPLRLPYFFASLCVFCYCFFNFGLIQFAGYDDIMTVWMKVFGPGAFFVIPALFNLMLFVGEQRKGAVKFVFLISCVLGLSALLYRIKTIPVQFVYFPWGNSISVTNIPYTIFFLNASICLPTGILLSYFQRDRICKTGLVKRQMNFILFGVLFANLAIFFDLLPAFGVNLYHMGSPLLATVFISLICSIASYRLLELDLLINKALFTILFIAPLILIHFIISSFFLQSSGVFLTTAFSLVIISSILLFTPYKLKIQRLVDKIVYRGRYDYQKILQEVCQSLVSMLDLDQLLDSVVHIIVQTMNVEKVAIFLEEEEKHIYQVKAAYGFDETLKEKLSLNNNATILERLRKDNRILVREELRQFEEGEEINVLFKTLDLIDAELIAPLFFKERLLGFIALSHKKTRHIYNQGDIDVLNAFSAEASVAIENARLYGEAIIDGLTRVFHHNYFYMRLKEEMARTKRYGNPIVLLMIDIDHFKSFNDSYGHQAGDSILKNIGQMLKTKLRNVDIAARYGGEEFAVILPGAGEKEKHAPAEIIRQHIQDALLVAERLRKVASEIEINLMGKMTHITISIGIAYYDGVDEKFTAAELVKRADVALYRAKQEGRNRVVFYSDRLETVDDQNSYEDKQY